MTRHNQAAMSKHQHFFPALVLCIFNHSQCLAKQFSWVFSLQYQGLNINVFSVIAHTSLQDISRTRELLTVAFPSWKKYGQEIQRGFREIPVVAFLVTSHYSIQRSASERFEHLEKKIAKKLLSQGKKHLRSGDFHSIKQP